MPPPNSQNSVEFLVDDPLAKVKAKKFRLLQKSVMVDFLISHSIVKTKRGANFLLILISLVALTLSVLIIYFSWLYVTTKNAATAGGLNNAAATGAPQVQTSE